MKWQIFVIISFAVCCLQIDAVSNVRFPIGGLFGEGNLENSKKAFLSSTKRKDIVSGHAISLNVHDVYSTALAVCEATKNKTAMAIIDARSTDGICDTTCLLCNKYNIIHSSLGWQPPEIEGLAPYYTFCYHPPPELISKAHAKLIELLEWDRFTIFYEEEEVVFTNEKFSRFTAHSLRRLRQRRQRPKAQLVNAYQKPSGCQRVHGICLMRIQEIMNSWPVTSESIIYKKLIPGGDNRETFKYILKEVFISFHVLDCHVDNIKHYLKEIVAVDNSTEYQSLILTSLDAYALDLDIPELKANVSVLHLTLANESRWVDLYMDGSSVRLESALAADAIDHLAKAIRNLQYTEETENHIRAGTRAYGKIPALCLLNEISQYEEMAWSVGEKLRDHLRDVTINGFTGNVEFDEQGRRHNFILHYSKMDEGGKFRHTGQWNSKTNTIDIRDDFPDRSSSGGTDRPISIVSRKGDPYFYEHEENGEKKYTGYAVDLMDQIFEYINKNQKTKFTYKFYRVAGDELGTYNNLSKKWNGIIGDLLEHKADLAVCDISITSEWNKQVDFSNPFLSLGISMLFKKPEAEPPDWFSFINPLSADVWLYLCFCYVIVSFVILICARMCQAEWVNPHPCNRNPETLQNIWDLYNCMWLTMGAIMTQGCDILPRAAGTRWVTGMWWFFALIITASYTANMSTFLSNDRRNTEVNNAKDLSEQTKITYGTIFGSPTHKFFTTSTDPVYSKIASVMESTKPSVFEATNDEGRERVLRSKGKYVFFMESTALEYYTARNCDLKMVGPKLDAKEYGIAMPRHFPHKQLINDAILHLQETSQLGALKSKWWNVAKDKACVDVIEDDSLQMKNSIGIFLVLGIGGVLGLVVAIIDFMLHAHKICVKEKANKHCIVLIDFYYKREKETFPEVTFVEAMASEWRESLNPRTLTKSTAPPRSAPPSPAGSLQRGRSASRAVSVLRAATSFINFDEIY
ncbi:Glutamate receptor ionotropic, kainate 2 [Eumeta japonica]|uniref:Glutamate receptor ionotropic, kainate 2 n=1 Tax=Eumeta variegata TaxID=151549 RepID=A0A4C1YY03_EUMVA|nr:Glutamate receptor ionotropic, kainate 2 [Eumeta japonica]